MKMIALQTVHARRFIPKDKAREDSKDRHQTVTVAPGQEFDTKDLGISDAEVALLSASGAAREKGKLDEAADLAKAAGGIALHPPAGGALPTADELEAMSRTDLDALAASRGVDISKVKNKGEVIDALKTSA